MAGLIELAGSSDSQHQAIVGPRLRCRCTASAAPRQRDRAHPPEEMARALGMHRECEAPHGDQLAAALLRRWRACGPCNDMTALMCRSPHSSAKATEPLSRMCWSRNLNPALAAGPRIVQGLDSALRRLPARAARSAAASHINLGVVRGRIRVSVTQHGVDRVQGRTASQHGRRGRVAEAGLRPLSGQQRRSCRALGS